VIFDGFPRTKEQALKLDKIINISKAIHLEVDDNLVLERICGRRVHMASGRSYHIKFNPPKVADIDDITGEKLVQRADDNEKTVKARLIEYKEKTGPLIDYYMSQGKIVTLNAMEDMKLIREKAIIEITGNMPVEG
jgi:adenylate kinase